MPTIALLVILAVFGAATVAPLVADGQRPMPTPTQTPRRIDWATVLTGWFVTLAIVAVLLAWQALSW